MITKVTYICNQQKNCQNKSCAEWLCKRTSDRLYAKTLSSALLMDEVKKRFDISISKIEGEDAIIFEEKENWDE